MMENKILSIVLRTADYREYDKMLTLLSQKHGKISALSRGCKKPNSSLYAASNVFSCAEFQLFQKNGFTTVTQAEMKKVFFHISNDMLALSCASVITAICERTAVEEVENARMFALLASVLYALDEGMDVKKCFVFFAVKMLDVLGVRPQLKQCVCCGAEVKNAKINISLGGVVCENCPGEAVPASYLHHIAKVLSLPSKEIFHAEIDAPVSFVKFMGRWMEQLIGNQLKSLEIFYSFLNSSEK